MVTVNTTDQCELYYEPGTSLDTYDISVLRRNCHVGRTENATDKVVEVHAEAMKQKKKVGAQHRDTYRVTEGRDEGARARGVVVCSGGTW